MTASQFYEQVQEAYLAYYGRPADPQGLDNWSFRLENAGGDLSAIINAFGNSAESQALYGSTPGPAQIAAIYEQLFGREPDAAGLAFYEQGLATGQFSLASIALAIYNGATGSDLVQLQAKLAYADAFTMYLEKSLPAEDAYNGSVASQNARAAVQSVTDTASEAAALTSLANTIVQIGNPSQTAVGITDGLTYTLATDGSSCSLTTGVDTITVPANNAVVIGDNTGAIVTSAADTITATGTNETLKVYVNAADTTIGVAGSGASEILPTMTGVQNLWISGANENGATLDVSGIPGLQSVTLDSMVIGTGGTATVKVTGQAVTLSDLSVAGTANETIAVASAADTLANVTLSKVAPATGASGAITLDINGAHTTTVNLTATGAADTVALSNTGSAMTTLNILGDQPLNLTESLNGVTTINASMDTGGVSLNAAGVSAFTFAAGSGANTIVTANSTIIADTGTTTTITNSGSDITITGNGNNTITATGNGSGSIEVGNGNNTITDDSIGLGRAITVGAGNNVIDLASHAGSVLTLGADSNYAADPTVPNIVIHNATAGDTIKFSGSSTGLALYELDSYVASSVTNLIQNMETLLAGNPRSAVAGSYGGNTYIVASSTGVLGPTDTTVVELVGLHGINISYVGQIQLIS